MPQDEKQKHNRPWHLKFHWHLHSSQSQKAKRPQPLDFTHNIPIPNDIPYPPFINIEGVPNFRDLGGYTCAAAPSSSPSSETTTGDDNGDSTSKFCVRQAYAYRCSELSQITANATHTMAETLKIKTLFDLRSEREAANPRGQPKGVKCISTPVFRKEVLTQALSVQQLRWAIAPDTPDGAGFSQGYVDWYRQIAVYGAKHAFRTIFEHIRDKPDEPFVFHCSAGKDRTGVLTALILKLCGVEDATVAWEYALTVPGMGVWEEAVEQEMVGDSMMPIRSHGGMTREEAHRLCGSRHSNMRRWLETVLQGEFGGAAMYLKEHAGFDQEDVKKIMRNLVVHGEGSVRPVEVKGMEDHPQT